MFKRKQLSSVQVPGLIALNFFVGFVFWYGIEKIFLSSELSIGATGIAVIAALYVVLTLILDVPASVIADRWGRKRMLAVAVVCFILANIVLGASSTFVLYLLGTVFWALFIVSYNGTYEAILYDSLKEQRREKAFQKIDALARLCFMVGIAISSMASGFLVDEFGIRSPYFLSIIPFVFALGTLLLIREPRVHHDDDVAEDVLKRGYVAHLVHALKTVRKSKELLLVAFAMVILTFIQTPMYEFGQYVYIELFSVPTLVGIFGGLSAFMLALGFLIAIKRTFSPRMLLLLVGLAIIIFAFLANNVSLVFISFIMVAIAIIENGLQTQLQHATTSRTRASVTSAVQIAGNVLIVPFLFLFGYIAQYQSIWSAYLITGVVVLALAGIYIFFWTRSKGSLTHG
jgi:MFS family permease